MDQDIMTSSEWLENEDAVLFQERVTRLEWLRENTPEGQVWTFPGCLISKYLFEEARYCYVYAQYLACIVMGMSFIEHTLAAMFYAAGRDDLERAAISKLLREAVKMKWLSKEEYDQFEKARSIRNPVTHFRSPLSDDTIEGRSMSENNLPYSLIEKDARYVMQIVLRLVGR